MLAHAVGVEMRAVAVERYLLLADHGNFYRIQIALIEHMVGCALAGEFGDLYPMFVEELLPSLDNLVIGIVINVEGR